MIGAIRKSSNSGTLTLQFLEWLFQCLLVECVICMESICIDSLCECVSTLTLHVCRRYMLPIIMLYLYIYCYLHAWLLTPASQSVFRTVCADPVSHSNIRDTSQSFTSACSCSPRLRCQVWLRLTAEIAMNSREWPSHTHTHTHTHSQARALCRDYWKGRNYIALLLQMPYVNSKWNKMCYIYYILHYVIWSVWLKPETFI